MVTASGCSPDFRGFDSHPPLYAMWYLYKHSKLQLAISTQEFRLAKTNRHNAYSFFSIPRAIPMARPIMKSDFSRAISADSAKADKIGVVVEIRMITEKDNVIPTNKNPMKIG